MDRLWAQHARYNTLANQTLYGACALLSDEAYRRDLGAFFKSVHGTLNHLMLGDRIWMARFEGGSHPSTGLDAILYEDFGALRRARAALDARIEAYFATLRADFASRTVRYVNNAGIDTEDPLSLVLPHFFNHQTHHRGQVHTLLSQLGYPAPVLDLHRVLKPDPPV